MKALGRRLRSGSEYKIEGWKAGMRTANHLTILQTLGAAGEMSHENPDVSLIASV